VFLVLTTVAFGDANTLQCLKDKCGSYVTSCEMLPSCKSLVVDCMSNCADDACQSTCVDDAGSALKDVGPSLIALLSLDSCGVLAFWLLLLFPQSMLRMKMNIQKKSKLKKLNPSRKSQSKRNPHLISTKSALSTSWELSSKLLMESMKFWI
jgi:hypothetical protein